MTFSKALKKLKKGKMVSRDSETWPNDRVLFFHQPALLPVQDPFMEMSFKDGIYLAYRDFTNQTIRVYSLSNEDLLADDWFVVEMEA